MASWRPSPPPQYPPSVVFPAPTGAVRGARTAERRPPPASTCPSLPRPFQCAVGTPRPPSASPLTLELSPSPPAPLSKLARESQSAPPAEAAATVHPVPPRCVQQKRLVALFVYTELRKSGGSTPSPSSSFPSPRPPDAARRFAASDASSSALTLPTDSR